MTSAGTRARGRELLHNTAMDEGEAFDDIERSFIEKSHIMPQFKIDHSVLRTNFEDWAGLPRIMMQEARVHETSQLLLLVQALPDALTDQFWLLLGAVDVLREHSAKVYKVNSDINVELHSRLLVTGVRVKCLVDSGAEIFLLDYDVTLNIDRKRDVCFRRRDVFLSIPGMDFESIGTADFTLHPGATLTFVVAKGLLHEVVLGMDILGDATLDLAHGIVFIPKLAFDGHLQRGDLGGTCGSQEHIATVEDLQILLNNCSDIFGPHPGVGSAFVPAAITYKDPDKIVRFLPRPLSEKVVELIRMGAITGCKSPVNTPIVVV